MVVGTAWPRSEDRDNVGATLLENHAGGSFVSFFASDYTSFVFGSGLIQTDGSMSSVEAPRWWMGEQGKRTYP